MLTLREKIIILYATAPEGFSATRLELRRKFREGHRKIWGTIDRLVAKQALEMDEAGTVTAGKAIKEETGADA